MENWIKVKNEDAVDLTLSMYVGEVCSECGHKFESLEDLKNRKPVCSEQNPLRFACKKCFEEKNSKSS